MLLNAAPAATKRSVGKEPVEDDLELVVCECGFHEFDVDNVGKSWYVVKEGWRGAVADLSVNLEGSVAAELPGGEYVRGGDDAASWKTLVRRASAVGGAPRIVSCIGSGGVCEGCDEIGCPGTFP